MRVLRLGWALVVATILAAGLSCTDSAGIDLVEVSATGGVAGVTFLDNNGNGVADGPDRPFPKLTVLLTTTRGGMAVSTAVTDTAGAFRMSDIPVGSYRLSLDPSTVGDSLSASGGAAEVLVRRDSVSRASVGVSYPVLSFEQIRTAEPGRKVFTSGIALNPRPNFGDGVVHLQADSLYLRMTNVARTTIATGDSLRVLGRIASDNGEPVLDDVTPFVLVNVATIPVPLERKTGSAASADGGKIDAALVRVRAAEIYDTATANGEFHFFVDDGTGRVEVVLRSFLQTNTSILRPDTILRIQSATGLLVPNAQPTGGVRWELQPRAGDDLVLEVKQADLRVEIKADTTVASKGDTLLFTAVVSNNGPMGASGIQVVDSVPVGFTLVDVTSTRGTYAQDSATWSLDTLAVGARDTLRMRAVVTTDLVGQTPARVTVKAPLKQVDPVTGNNTATVVITVRPPPAGSTGRLRSGTPGILGGGSTGVAHSARLLHVGDIGTAEAAHPMIPDGSRKSLSLRRSWRHRAATR